MKGQWAKILPVHFINWNINKENQNESNVGILMSPYYRLISVSPISDKEKSYKGKEHSKGNKNDKRNRKKGMVAKPKGHHLNTPSP